MKSDRFSLPVSAASMRANVPSRKRAGVCSPLILGRPTPARISDITFSAKPAILLISPIDRVNDISYLDDIRYGGKSMTNTLTIIGYEMDDHCSHCGRKLVHCVDTAEMGLIGADCFNKLIKANTKKYSGNGKPGASLVRDMAKLRDRVSDAGLSSYGRHPNHFVFEVAA
ncbi:hypothetical protein [Sphingomonas crocodyli]|nr:hypothetical protein [Sphingomonas crocodyli]